MYNQQYYSLSNLSVSYLLVILQFQIIEIVLQDTPFNAIINQQYHV